MTDFVDVLGDGTARMVVLESSVAQEAALPGMGEGWNAVVRFRALDPSTGAVIITSDEVRSWSRVLLSC